MVEIMSGNRKKTSAYAEKINKIRSDILDMDSEMICFLGQRMGLAAKLGKLKKIAGITVVEKNREKKLFAIWSKKAIKAGLNAKFVAGLWKIILKESIRIQKS
jgi:chorismate mutase